MILILESQMHLLLQDLEWDIVWSLKWLSIYLKLVNNNSNTRKNRNYACVIYYSRAFSSRGRQTRNLDLKDAFGNMDIVEQRNMLDGLLRGMLKQRLQKADKNFADDVKILYTYSYVGIIF